MPLVHLESALLAWEGADASFEPAREARAKAIENRRSIEQGIDPRGGGIPTFAQAVEKVIALHSKNWSPGLSTRPNGGRRSATTRSRRSGASA